MNLGPHISDSRVGATTAEEPRPKTPLSTCTLALATRGLYFEKDGIPLQYSLVTYVWSRARTSVTQLQGEVLQRILTRFYRSEHMVRLMQLL